MVTTPAARYPVKIGANWFVTDLALFERAPLKSIAQSFDTSREPGEQSLGNEGVWKRSQFDFIHGAGQINFDDDEENDRRRFDYSLGADIWTRNQISALPLTTEVDSNIGDGNFAEMAILDDTLFVVSSGSTAEGRRTMNGTVWNPCTGEPNITTGFSLVALGDYVYLSSGSTLVRATTAGAFSSFGSLTPDYLVAAADRMLGLEDNTIYEIDNTGAKVNGNIYEHFDTTYQFKGGAYSPAGVYVFGDDGTRSTVSLLVPIDSTTEFAPPYPVMELPDGELIRSIRFYGGVVILATSLGFRLAQVGANGTLTYGPLREIGDLLDLEVQKQYCWFAWSNVPGDYLSLTTRSGLGRMGLDRFTEPLVPSYASDLLTPSGSNTVRCCAFFSGQMYFGVDDASALDVFTEHASSKVPTMELGAGQITYGIPEQKAVTSFQVRHSALAASQEVDLSFLTDNGTTVNFDASTTDGDIISTFTPSANVEAEAIYPLISVTTNNAAFTLYRWTLRVVPMVRRSERIRLGVMLYEQIDDYGHTPVRMDPQTQWEYLLGLMNGRSMVDLVMGDRTDTGFVDAIMLDQNQGQDMIQDWDDNGFINATWLVEFLTNADA